MRKLLSLVVMSGTLALAGSGCAVSPGDDPAAQTSYGFVRDSAGQPKRTDATLLEDFTPAQAFDRSVPSGHDPSATEVDPQSVSCSGVCDANVCVCSGDLDCCIIGCILCWELAG